MKRIQAIFVALLVLILLVGLLPAQEVNAAEEKNGYMTLVDAAAYARKEVAQFKQGINVKFYLESAEPYSDSELMDFFKAEMLKHTGVPDEGDYMRWSFQQCSYNIVDDFDGKTHYVTLSNLTPTYNNTAEQEVQLEKKLDQVMASLNLSGKSDYEKVKIIYEYICKNVKYAEEVLFSGADPLNPPDELRVYYSAYGALVLGSTTCQGFASLTYRMMLKAGIDCRLICGGNHGWNIVKLDGKYYYLDATADSDNYRIHGEPQFFLKGSASFRTGGNADGSGGSASHEYKTWTEFFDKDFLEQYPISVLDYGEADLLTGNAGTVLGSGQCGDQATWTLTADGKLTVSGSGEIWSSFDGTFWATENGFKMRWDGLNGYIKQIVIQQGITAIGDYAFCNCPRLTKIDIAASVESIGFHGFAMCENLTQVTIPNTVKTLGDSAFYQCVRMEKVVISSGMQEIPKEAFIGCTELKTVTIPNGVKTIGENAFAVCPKLQNIDIPASITSLGSGAFVQSFDASKKITLTVPETVTQIGWQCFAESGLYGIKLKAKVQKLESYMFNYCHNLRSVELSDTIKSFTDNTFYDCRNLVEVKLPSKLEDLGIWAFVSCISLKEVVLPDTLKEIPDATFNDCKSLSKIKIPASVLTIGGSAFGACTSLKEITIPASVKKISDGAFGDCKALATVRFEGNAPEIEGGIFTFAGNITVYYPRNNNTWTQAVKDQLTYGHPYVTFTASHGANDPHTAGVWQYDANTHWQVCPDCGASSNEAAHNWDAGRITKQPNCKEAGKKVYTCQTCGATKEESIPKTSEHSYDYSCDEQCNVCGATRAVEHTFGTQWQSNKENHWHYCTVCGKKTDEAAHTPGPEATEETAQECTTCGWVIAPALNHVHDENMQMRSDEVGHWYTCSGCSEKVAFAEHNWQSACDASCDECGYTRDVSHRFETEWTFDTDHHWHACSECQERTDVSAHQLENGVCIYCGWEGNVDQKPTEPEPEVTEPEPTEQKPAGTEIADSEPSEEADGEDRKEFPVWIPVVIVIAIAGAAGAVILLKKKRD